MPGLTVHAVSQNITKIETDALVVGFHDDVRPLKGIAGELDWLLCGALSSLIIAKKLRGALGEVALVTSQGKVPANKIFMVGLGPRRELSMDTLRAVARTVAASALDAGVVKAGWEFISTDEIPADNEISVLCDGLYEGSAGRSFDVTLLAGDADKAEQISRHVPRSLSQPAASPGQQSTPEMRRS